MHPLAKAGLRRIGVEPYLRLSFAHDSAPRQRGWFRSVFEQASVDADGNPIPWLTYPSIEFLGKRLAPHHRLFEYGSGGSTIWFGARVSSVVTLEHSPEWAEKVRPSLPANVALHVRPQQDSRHYDEISFLGTDEENPYTGFIVGEPTLHHVIVIDGVYRNACIRKSLERLSPDGVVIVDNTDFAEFGPGKEVLMNHGFRSIDFAGMCPIVQRLSQTSVFYRRDNCFGI